MTTSLAEPLTTFGVLFPGAEGDVPPLGMTLPDVDLDVIDGLPPDVQRVVGEAVRQDVDAAIAKVADQSLTDLLMAGWRKEEELRAAGRRTADQPGRKETVALVAHKIVHELHPTIVVELDGAEVGKIPLTVSVEAKVEGLCVRVAFGKAWEVLSGSATFTVKLTVGSAPAWSRAKKVELPGVLRLDDGLALV